MDWLEERQEKEINKMWSAYFSVHAALPHQNTYSSADQYQIKFIVIATV